MNDQLRAIVLAAGKGSRFVTEGEALPKVMRRALGKPVLSYVLAALDFIPQEDITLVVGYLREKVTEAFPQYPYAVQAEQLGTGHAALSARAALDGFDGDVLIAAGDMPLISRETYLSLVKTHRESGNDCTVLTGYMDDPGSFGRVQRKADGSFDRIVEARDCTPEQYAIKEVNSAIYVFKARKLLPALLALKNENAQSEYYLTDAPDIILSWGGKVGISDAWRPEDMTGVNTPKDLAAVEAALTARG